MKSGSTSQVSDECESQRGWPGIGPGGGEARGGASWQGPQCSRILRGTSPWRGERGQPLDHQIAANGIARLNVAHRASEAPGLPVAARQAPPNPSGRGHSSFDIWHSSFSVVPCSEPACRLLRRDAGDARDSSLLNTSSLFIPCIPCIPAKNRRPARPGRMKQFQIRCAFGGSRCICVKGGRGRRS